MEGIVEWGGWLPRVAGRAVIFSWGFPFRFGRPYGILGASLVRPDCLAYDGAS